MDKRELRSKLFDAVLEEALREDFRLELEALPESAEGRALAPSAELDRKIERLIRDSRHRVTRKRFRRNARRTAVAAAVLVAVSFGSLMSVEASRNAIFNAIVSLRSDHAEIQFQDGESSGAQKPGNVGTFRLTYLPDGFTETNAVKMGTTFRTEYQNDKGVCITFYQYPLSETGINTVDTEHTTHREIQIHKREADLFQAKTPEEKSSIVWGNSTTSFILVSTLDSDELIRIAESVQ